MAERSSNTRPRKPTRTKRKSLPSNKATGASVDELVAALGPGEGDRRGGRPGKVKRARRRSASEPDAAKETDEAALAPEDTEAPLREDEGGDEVDAADEVASPDVWEQARRDGVMLSDTLPMEPDDDLSRIEGEASPRLMSIVESLLFAATKPMTIRELRKLLKETSLRQVQLAVKQLMLDSRSRGIVIVQVAGGFRLRTHPENAPWVQQLLSGKPTRLSRSQLESLAVIAYQQPITKAEVDHLRGVDCGAVLKVLLERDLIQIVGRKEEPGRPHLYGTTVKFLEFFNLRSLRDMPDLHEFRELTEESQATLREELGDDNLADEQEAMGQEVLAFDEDAAPPAGEGKDARAPEPASEAGDYEPAEAEPERDEADEPDERDDDEPEPAEPEARAAEPDDEPEPEPEPEPEARAAEPDEADDLSAIDEALRAWVASSHEGEDDREPEPEPASSDDEPESDAPERGFAHPAELTTPAPEQEEEP